MRIVICGAAGRDFHDYLTLYRDDPNVEVVAFTATQIPYIDERRFPAELAGERYPRGIAVHPEEELERLIREHRVDQVVFAYSDVTEDHVMALGARAVAAGADLVLPGARTMLRSAKPVIGVGAVRTGCGKSQTVRWLLDRLGERGGVRAVGIRHPMPYDPDLTHQIVQRFASREDLVEGRCTIEEREEYEPYVERGRVVYAGVDYRAILARAEAEADVVLWDGGNNDLPFVRPDLYLVLTDPHRPGDALRYWPSRSQLALADVILVAKSDTASPEAVASERALAARANPNAQVIAVASRLSLVGLDARSLAGKRVVCVEDGPTTTHGGVPYGAATLLARRAGAVVVDPRPAFVGELRHTLEAYPGLGPLVPAVGYSEAQRADLQATLGAVDADVILSGTPIDLARLVTDPRGRPLHRVRYDLAELPGEPSLGALLDEFLLSRVLR
ncbi:MAG: GTPase [Alphaproteobacteria bacterium]|nr:GTPase [Alphaproteobacteria bacterium]MCB9695722.1 GTPase [Alphaproteobacteria bacterium]